MKLRRILPAPGMVALAAALVVAAVLVLTWSYPASQRTEASNQADPGRMSLEVSGTFEGGAVTCDSKADTKCTLDKGSTFTVSIVPNAIPVGGYPGWVTMLDYGDLLYKPTADAADEIKWDLSLLTLRSPDPLFDPFTGQLNETWVAHGDLSAFFEPAPRSQQKTALVNLEFNCAVKDLPPGPHGQTLRIIDFNEDASAAAFIADLDTRTVLVPAVDSMEINCFAPTPTPCPTEKVPADGGCGTLTPTATDTATPAAGTPTATSTPALCEQKQAARSWDFDETNCFDIDAQTTTYLWHWETDASVPGMSGGTLAFNQGCTGPGVTGCTYHTGITVGGRTESPDFDPLIDGILTFETARSTEANACGSYDRTFVQYSTDGDNYLALNLLAGTISEGAQTLQAGGEICGQSLTAQTVTVPLPPGTTNIAFLFDSVDAHANQFPGQFVDDVSITAGPTPTPCPDGICATRTPTTTPTATACPAEVCTPTPSPTPPPGTVWGNDNFADAWIISSLPFFGSQSTVEASTEPGEPLSPDGCITVQPKVMGHTVWYQFTAPESGTVGADTFDSLFDTVLAAYAGDAVHALTPLACNDDTSGFQSQVSFPVTAGISYHLQVGGFSAASGELVLNVSLAPGPPGPIGDVNCDGTVNVVDALFILQYEVGLRVDGGGCPLPPDALYVAAGDVNNDGLTNVVDALFILQCEVGIPNSFCPET